MAPRFAHLIGSKFTSVELVEGWRQFHVVGLRKVDGGYDVELHASCDKTVILRLPSRELFDLTRWTPGWKPLSAL